MFAPSRSSISRKSTYFFAFGCFALTQAGLSWVGLLHENQELADHGAQAQRSPGNRLVIHARVVGHFAVAVMEAACRYRGNRGETVFDAEAGIGVVEALVALKVVGIEPRIDPECALRLVFDHCEGVIRLGELDVLSPRELEVLTLLGHGMAIKDIAETLQRSTKTIERHRESIVAKLSLLKAVVLADQAREAGLSLIDAARTLV